MVKKILHGCKLPLVLFSFLIIFFFFTLRSSPQKPAVPSRSFTLSDEERRCLKEFFREILFDDRCAYTLFGTKPISSFCVQIPPSEEDKAWWKEYYAALSEEEKAKLVLVEPLYDFYANYHKWLEIKRRFPIRQYLFGTFSSRFRKDTKVVLFVNIEMALRTLLKFYDDFRRALGFDFDPFQVVFEVENDGSKFWNGVMDSHALQGILLGYGRDNAWFFEWNAKYEKIEGKMGDFVRSLPSLAVLQHFVPYPNPHHFMLPTFGNYGLYSHDNPLIEQYKKEREAIKALYQGRDEVDVALDWLTR